MKKILFTLLIVIAACGEPLLAETDGQLVPLKDTSSDNIDRRLRDLERSQRSLDDRIRSVERSVSDLRRSTL